MSDANFDFVGLAELWRRSLERGLKQLGRKQANHHFYALAFHVLYAEENGVIAMPALAVNSIQGLVADHGPGAEHDTGFFKAVRWSPADWHWPELDLPYRRQREHSYRKLTQHARRSTTAHWRRSELQHRRALIKALKTITRAKSDGPLAEFTRTSDFVAFVHEPSRDGLDWVKKSVPKRLFHTLFAEYENKLEAKAQIGRKDTASRAEFLISRFGVFDGAITSEDAERELLTMGRKAVPALTAALADPKHGWQAAMILSRIGPGAKAAADALKTAMHDAEDQSCREWSARALASLGQYAVLEDLISDRTVGPCAAEGLLAGRPTTYPHLERALASSQTKVRQIVLDGLKPGQGSYDPTGAELDQMEVGLQSSWASIRCDAVSNLSSSTLGHKGRSIAIKHLLAALEDDSDDVRRMATLCLGWSGKAARAHRDRIKAMKLDRAQSVRDAADIALRELR